MIIEGSIAVKAAILGGRREVKEVYFDVKKKTKDFAYLRFLCHDLHIPFQEMDREEIDAMAKGKTHGGILADVGERRFEELSSLKEKRDLFYIDGIEDPFNLGYIFRTLCAFGFSGVVLPKRDLSFFEPTLLKSSAGAFDRMDIYRSEDIIKDLSTIKEYGFKTYALYRGEESKDVFDTSFPAKACYLLGGEKRGIGSRVLELVDETIYISYGSDFRNALNASGALDVLATLVYQERRKEK